MSPPTTFVTVTPLPHWMPIPELLGEHAWEITSPGKGQQATASMTQRQAADLDARLRGLGFAGQQVVVSCEPKLQRALVRSARTEDARRRRKTTPGFNKRGTRLDKEGRVSLTPESLALTLGELADGRSILDAGCGVGGNTIGFARAGCSVTALEPDNYRLQCARHNAQRYGVSAKIQFIQGRAPAVLHEHRAAILFVDPPWGAQWDRVCCALSALPLLQQVFSALSRPKLNKRYEAIWVKVPSSFDTRTLPEEAEVTPFFGEGSGDNQRVKFLILQIPTSAFCA